MNCQKCGTEMRYYVEYNQWCEKCEEHHYIKELDPVHRPDEQVDMFEEK